jgi:hypothetical protein
MASMTVSGSELNMPTMRSSPSLMRSNTASGRRRFSLNAARIIGDCAVVRSLIAIQLTSNAES